MKNVLTLCVILMSISICAEEVPHLKISGSDLCGGVQLGSRSLKPRHIFGSKISYSEDVHVYGYKDEALCGMLCPMGAGLFGKTVKPSSLCIDGGSRRIYEVSGRLLEEDFEFSGNAYQRLKDTVDTFREMFGVVLYTSPNPVSDRVHGRTWIGKFVDRDNHTCYVRLFLRHSPVGSILENREDAFQHYERECKCEILLIVLDANCASDENRTFTEHLYQRLKNDSAKPQETQCLYKNVSGCITILQDNNGGKSTGFLARANGQVYLYTNRHIPQPGLNQFADPDLSATTTDGRFVNLGRLQIPLFLGDEHDVARYELIDYREMAIDLDAKVEFNVGDRVWIFGNSGAGDVVTSIEGKILGIGPKKIEVDAKFVPGNSGSPVFNERGQVIGIVSYIHVSEKNVATAGTRFSERRYFVARLDCLQLGFESLGCWWRVGKDRTNKECSKRRSVETLRKAIQRNDRERKYLQNAIDKAKRQTSLAKENR